MKFILGKKIGMTRKFQQDGTVIPVTKIQAGPCTITQIKEKKKDGYSAVQVGFGKKRNLTKSLSGHLKNLEKFQYLKEFRIENPEQFKRGDNLNVSIFEEGDLTKISGISKGKGFQGVVKRHKFHGSPATHGHKDQLRMPGSIGSSFPQHVVKGKRMPGRMGAEKVTIKNLKIVAIDNDKNYLFVKGAVPGAINNLLLISTVSKIKSNKDTKPVVEEKAREEKVNQAEKKK